MKNQRQFDVLQSIEWAEEHFGSLITNRVVTRRDVVKLVKVGLAESAGMVLMCDEDGSMLDPERYREGFKMTPKGRETLKELERQLEQLTQ